MLRRLRTYRILPAAMALALVLGGSVALVQHVCAMAGLTGMSEMAHRHCAGMAEHRETAKAHPCPDAAGHITQPDALSHSDCCLVQAEHGQPEAVPVASPTIEPVLSLAASLLVLPPPTRGAETSLGVAYAGPPLPTPVSLTVLHGSFLI